MIKFIKMKKKIIFAVATGFFAVATVFNMNLLQGNSVGDVSLDAITVMAQAQSEGYELPEATITCDGSGGRCWAEDTPHRYLGPFGYQCVKPDVLSVGGKVIFVYLVCLVNS